LSVVAQNISVTFESNFKENKILINQIHGSRREPTVIVGQKKYSLDMGDIYAEEKKNIMVSIELPERIQDNQLVLSGEGENIIREFNVGSFIMEYIDVLNGDLRTFTLPVNIKVGNDDSMTVTRNSSMTAAIARLEAKKAVDEAKICADRGDTTNAREILQTAIDTITEMKNSINHDEIEIIEEINSIIEDLNQDKNMFANVHVYRSIGKCAVESRLTGMHQQRAMYSPDELREEGMYYNKKSKARGKMIESSRSFMASKKG